MNNQNESANELQMLGQWTYNLAYPFYNFNVEIIHIKRFIRVFFDLVSSTLKIME